MFSIIFLIYQPNTITIEKKKQVSYFLVRIEYLGV